MNENLTTDPDPREPDARVTAEPDAGDGYSHFLAGQEAMLAWMRDPANDAHPDMAEIRAALHREHAGDADGLTDAEREALASVIYGAENGPSWIEAQTVVARIKREAEQRTGERIAQEIEAQIAHGYPTIAACFRGDARIARESR